MKTFMNKHPILIVLAIAIPLLYLEFLWLGQSASKLGCFSKFTDQPSIEQRKFCVAYKNAQYPFYHADFTANGKHYAWNDEIDMYEEIKQSLGK